ncbi:MAG: hypothetical protein ABUS79_14450 [Pseudomonadota bacterium]
MNGPVHEDVFQEPDRLPHGLLLRITVGTITVGLSLCIIAYLLLRAREHGLRPSGVYPETNLPAPHRVGQVRQEVFTIATPKPTPLEQQTRALEEYGWIDRRRGIVHVPIEVGMDLVLADARAGKASP